MNRRYELIGTIARSKRADVKLAIRRDGAYEDLVVIKIVRDGAPQEAVDSLRNEFMVLKWIRDPGVVEAHDFGCAAGRSFLVMEYLDWHSLLEVLCAGRSGRRLDVISTARVVARAARALHVVHALTDATGNTALDLVHDDVSLSNVMVLRDGRVKLIDFGLAKTISSTLKVDKVHGKLSCMAPEKLRGSGSSRASDIFALGCVFQLATQLYTLRLAHSPSR